MPTFPFEMRLFLVTRSLSFTARRVSLAIPIDMKKNFLGQERLFAPISDVDSRNTNFSAARKVRRPTAQMHSLAATRRKRTSFTLATPYIFRMRFPDQREYTYKTLALCATHHHDCSSGTDAFPTRCNAERNTRSRAISFVQITVGPVITY